ncbi:uncharacterized protein LOC110842792 isoform X2 [Folsomia candida]|nr:uncharacterized protein LOC110842792 isoform X2 [Folsomia candida]
MAFSNACKIYLRHDQKAKDVGTHSYRNVAIYAPSWIKEGLEKLSLALGNTKFAVFEPRRGDKPLDEFTVGPKMSLATVQKISRNEEQNVSGTINKTLYAEGGLEDMLILLAMKDLVRQSIIVGRDVATHYGGYGSSRVKMKAPRPIYICDLAGLQFQRKYNTGRLVLLFQKQSPDTVGLLDDFIFEHVVGEKRKSYDEAKADHADRYISTQSFGNVSSLFDVYAYQKFVASDVVLAGLAVAEMASRNGERVAFKFLKYGTGFFAGSFSRETNKNILKGVVMGLEILFSTYGSKVLGQIKHLEFPFYQIDEECKAKLETIKEKYDVSFSFSHDDALKPMPDKGLIVATTNCGDSMAVLGNEMSFSSVDAAIAENLKSKGAIFCPILNPEIEEKFLDV